MSARARLEGVVKRVGPPGRRHEILRGVTCQLPAGRVVGLLGRNGAGKTTLLRLLAGQARPTSGNLLWDGPRSPRRVGLPEGRALPRLGTAERWQNVFAPVDEPRRRWLLDLLELGELWRRPIRHLSTGERRRAELALTLSAEADLFLLDEPTSGLDPLHVEGAGAAVRRVVAQGATVVLSTHLVREHEDLVDHVILLHEGRVVAEGGAEALRDGCLALRPDRAVEVAEPGERWVVAADGRYLCRGEEARWRLEERFRRLGIGWAVEPASLRDAFVERVGST